MGLLSRFIYYILFFMLLTVLMVLSSCEALALIDPVPTTTTTTTTIVLPDTFTAITYQEIKNNNSIINVSGYFFNRTITSQVPSGQVFQFVTTENNPGKMVTLYEITTSAQDVVLYYVLYTADGSGTIRSGKVTLKNNYYLNFETGNTSSVMGTADDVMLFWETDQNILLKSINSARYYQAAAP